VLQRMNYEEMPKIAPLTALQRASRVLKELYKE
jgi:hypothetical protein